jgi:hypothetical protein
MENKKNFKRLLIGSFFLLLSLHGFTQTDSLISRVRTSSNLLISYNSSLIYPGIRIGIEIPVNSVNLTKNANAGRSKSIIKDRYISLESGWYHHPGFHDNLYFTAEWTWRRTYKEKLFNVCSFGTGYSRTFLGGTTYNADKNGTVNIISAAGYNYALIIAGAGIGFDFSKSRGIPLSIFAKFDILTMFPYNSTIYFRPIMELGLIYKPENFLQIVTKKRVKKK